VCIRPDLKGLLPSGDETPCLASWPRLAYPRTICSPVLINRAGESIVIAGEIEVEILEITPTRVKLGNPGAKEIAVVRKEVRAHCRREPGSRARNTAGRSSARIGAIRVVQKRKLNIRFGFLYGAFTGKWTTLLT
jgi:carbon storage regulator CsrA